MFCNRCGTRLADGSQFCVECGHTVDGSSPAVPAPRGDAVCAKCDKSIFPSARFCSNCGSEIPAPAVIAVADGQSAAAATMASEPIYLPRRRPRSPGRLALWSLAAIVLGALAWAAASGNSVASEIKQYVTTAHAETIAEGSVAIKPNGFASYKLTVPEGAIDVAVTGQFDARGRAEKDIRVLLLSDTEFVIWQGGYAISPYYDSGNVSQSKLQAQLPSRPGTYYLIFSNKPSRVEKTVHLTAGLQYDTWLPDSLMAVKEKMWRWFE